MGSVRGNDCDCVQLVSPSKYCQRSYCEDDSDWSEELCDCVPKMTTQSCAPQECEWNFNWNQEKCSCSCDRVAKCKQGFFWSLEKCHCVSNCFGLECSGNFKPDFELCQCVCSLNEGDCPPGTFLQDCNCVTDNSEPSSSMYQPSSPCEPAEPCPIGTFWRPETCQCEVACDFVEDCPSGQRWDLFACGCVWDSSSTLCAELMCQDNEIFNPTSCSCECSLKETDCQGPLAYLDNDFCECRRHPCDPVQCLDGQEINWETCSCVPSPLC